MCNFNTSIDVNHFHSNQNTSLVVDVLVYLLLLRDIHNFFHVPHIRLLSLPLPSSQQVFHFYSKIKVMFVNSSSPITPLPLR